ncbi:MAG TPA: hypothetical protein VFT72_04810 [Opitutaceae bacterium]|nr:hypothetical protein [Opitutaceae bacterium]
MLMIERELLSTERNISTNLTVQLPALQAYMERRYPRVSIDVCQRVRILSEGETPEFWKYRGPRRWVVLEDDLMGGRYVEDKGEKGTLFIIDEAGACGFSATAWASKVGQSTRGEQITWYLDQQRKFGDDVVASCNGRMPTPIAKPFRDKAHYFVKLRNGYQAQFGIFRGQGKFTASHFAQEPGPNVEVIKKESWSIEKGGIMDCYRTQDGVGVAGNKADLGKRAKGVPIMMVFPMFIAAGLLIAFVPWLLGKGIGRFLGGKSAQHEVPSAKRDIKQLVRAGSGDASTVRPLESDEVYCTGFAVWGGRARVMMSDGRFLDEHDPKLTQIGRTFVVYDGVRYLIRTSRVRKSYAKEKVSS